MPTSLDSQSAGDFSWIPFYAEVAERLVISPETLVELSAKLAEGGALIPACKDRSADGTTFPLAQMDPFTFFASFNRRTTDANRLTVLTALQHELSLSSPVPTGFSGIPLFDNRNTWFFPYEPDRKPDDLPNLCKLARVAVEGGLAKVTPELFSACAAIERVGIRKLTIGLFLLNPKEFLPLDRKTRALLTENGVAADDVRDLPTYAAVIDAVSSRMGKNFPALSHQAHVSATTETGAWLFQANPKQYDLATELRKHKPGDADRWSVTRFQNDMKRGDRVVLWQAGEDAGIYATGTLTGKPEYQESPNPYSDSEKRWALVPFVYDEILARPVLKDVVRANPVTAEMAVIKQPAGTNFRLTSQEWEEIQAMLETGEEVSEEVAEEPYQEDESAKTGLYWKISPGRNAVEWPEWKANGIAAIGWPKLGDVSGLDRDGFDDRCRKAAAEDPKNYRKSGMDQVWRFSQIRPGTRLVANDGTTRVLGIGTVTGLYRFVPGAHKPHQLPVRWDDTRERGVRRGGWRQALIQLSREDFEEIAAAGTDTTRPVKAPPQKAKPTITFDGFVAQLENQGYSFPDDLVAAYMLALQAKRFVILAGISGTGKTKLASVLAQTFSECSAGARDRADGDSGYRVQIRPYMLKHNRMWLPVDFVAQVPGLLEKASADGRISVRFDGRDPQELRLWRKEQSNLVGLFWSGPIREVFSASFQEGDEVQLHASRGATARDIALEVRSAATSARISIKSTFEVVAVRPDWTDNRGLLGFYNPLTKVYSSTPFLNLVMAAAAEEEAANKAQRDPLPFFAILDEMNLARVEHYFSDFLSCLESGDSLHLHDDQAVEEGEADGCEAVPRRLRVPRNLFFTGTVNVDETTHMFSPKVLDRAFTLEFNEVDLDGYGLDVEQDSAPPSALRLGRFDGALRLDSNPGPDDWKKLLGLGDEKLVDSVRGLHRVLEADHRHFGYRVANEIARFVNLAAAQAGKETETVWAALDVAILAKVLPKLHGTQQELETLLSRLFDFTVRCSETGTPTDSGKWEIERGKLKWTGEGEAAPALPRSAAKLWRMLRRLRRQGFTAFIE